MSYPINNKIKRYIKNSSIFSLLTFFSRILGLLRDMLKAYAFGTSIYAVIFDLAFRIPNALRNLLAEGVLSHAFIPLYQEKKNLDEKKEFAKSTINFLLILFSILTFLLYWIFPYLAPILLGNQYNTSPEILSLTIFLLRFLFPYIIFISITSIYIGIQQSNKKFWNAAFSPILLNLIVIIPFSIILFLHSSQWINIQQNTFFLLFFSALSLLAALINLLFQRYITTKTLNISLSIFSFKFHKSNVKQLLFIMLPAIFGASILEIGKIIDILLANQIKEVPGALSALTYSHRLIHLPIGVFGVALATTLLPSISESLQKKKYHEYHKILSSAILMNLYILIPCTLGIFFYAEEIITTLFFRGSFDQESVYITSSGLKYYAWGILGYSLQKVLFTAFYAQKNSKTPTYIAIFVLISNLILSILLMKPLLHKGLALGSSISIYLGIVIYIITLTKKNLFSIKKNKRLQRNSIKIIFINFIFFCILYILSSTFQFSSIPFINLLIHMIIAITLYVFISHQFNIQEWKQIYLIFKNNVSSH